MDLMDYRRKIIANSPHLKSASGAVATFSDEADLPLESLNVDIESVQSGTGDPSPTNIRPISGWNGVKVTRCGKNLYSRENGEYNVPVFDASGNSQSYPDVNVVWIKVKPNTAYTTTLILNSSQQAYARWIECDEYKNFIWRDSNMDTGANPTRTRTTRSNTRWVQIACNQYPTAQISKNAWEIMFTEGSTATPYEPYNGVDVSVDLGQTVYGGTLNPLTGVMTVDSQLITGDNNWGVYWNSHKAEQVDTNKRASFMLSLTNETVYAQKASAKCNMLIHDTVVLNGLGNKSAFCLHPTLGRYLYACLPLDTLGMSSATSATSDNDFKAAIQALGNDLQIVIPLATPYTIQLTPQQIRSLYGNNTIFADTGNVALEYWAHP